jgi:hypothetical protein
MTDAEGYQLAEDLKQLVFVRTGLLRHQLVCPREKSEMTPCVARDGGMCVVFTTARQAICVGCEADVEDLLKKERAKAQAAP